MVEEKKNIKVTVLRFDPSVDKESRYVTYEIPYDKVIEEKMTVLTVLLYIYDNLDRTLSFQYSCRGGDCHSCDVIVNGRAVEACAERVTGDITIEPPIRQGFEVIKDLVATDILLRDKDHIVTRNKHARDIVESFAKSSTPDHALIKLTKSIDSKSFSEEEMSRLLGMPREKISNILKELEKETHQ